MRRVAFVVASVAAISSAIACGGILGFGDDGEGIAPTSGNDAGGGGDVTTAEGGAAFDAAGESCETRTLVLGTDAGIAGPDWSKGITTTTGGAALVVEEGKLISRSGDGNQGTKAEATLFATRSGNATRIRCAVRAESSSFADVGRLLEFRLEAPQWAEYYGVRLDWQGGVFRVAYQARPAGGTTLEDFPRLPPITEDRPHDIVMEMRLGSAPTIDVTIDGIAAATVVPPATGDIPRTQAVIGTVAFPPFAPHEVRYESVVCEMCIAP